MEKENIKVGDIKMMWIVSKSRSQMLMYSQSRKLCEIHIVNQRCRRVLFLVFRTVGPLQEFFRQTLLEGEKVSKEALTFFCQNATFFQNFGLVSGTGSIYIQLIIGQDCEEKTILMGWVQLTFSWKHPLHEIIFLEFEDSWHPYLFSWGLVYH